MSDQKDKSEDNKSPENTRTSDKKKNSNKQRLKNRKKKSYDKSRDRRTNTTKFKESIEGMNEHLFEIFTERLPSPHLPTL